MITHQLAALTWVDGDDPLCVTQCVFAFNGKVEGESVKEGASGHKLSDNLFQLLELPPDVSRLLL